MNTDFHPEDRQTGSPAPKLEEKKSPLPESTENTERMAEKILTPGGSPAKPSSPDIVIPQKPLPPSAVVPPQVPVQQMVAEVRGSTQARREEVEQLLKNFTKDLPNSKSLIRDINKFLSKTPQDQHIDVLKRGLPLIGPKMNTNVIVKILEIVAQIPQNQRDEVLSKTERFMSICHPNEKANMLEAVVRIINERPEVLDDSFRWCEDISSIYRLPGRDKDHKTYLVQLVAGKVMDTGPLKQLIGYQSSKQFEVVEAVKNEVIKFLNKKAEELEKLKQSYLDNIPDENQKAKIRESFGKIPEDQLTEVLKKTLPLIKDQKNGIVRAQILDTVAKKPENAEVLKIVVPFLNDLPDSAIPKFLSLSTIIYPRNLEDLLSIIDGVKSSAEKAKIIDALATTQYEINNVVENIKPILEGLPDEAKTANISFVASMDAINRTDAFARGNSLMKDVTDPTQRFKILGSLVTLASPHVRKFVLAKSEPFISVCSLNERGDVLHAVTKILAENPEDLDVCFRWCQAISSPTYPGRNLMATMLQLAAGIEKGPVPDWIFSVNPQVAGVAKEVADFLDVRAQFLAAIHDIPEADSKKLKSYLADLPEAKKAEILSSLASMDPENRKDAFVQLRDLLMGVNSGTEKVKILDAVIRTDPQSRQTLSWYVTIFMMYSTQEHKADITQAVQQIIVKDPYILTFSEIWCKQIKDPQRIITLLQILAKGSSTDDDLSKIPEVADDVKQFLNEYRPADTNE